MTEHSMWGQLDDIVNMMHPPALILKEQADLLVDVTSGYLEGKVHQLRSKNPDLFVYGLVIKARLLDDYTHSIVKIAHTITLYPVELSDLTDSFSFERRCETAEVLKRELGKILSSESVTSVLRSLIAQSRFREQIIDDDPPF